jgi:hypothetical protein
MADIELDASPSGEEEARAFLDIRTARGDYDEERAKIRIDAIARWLAIFWTIFLWYVILAQGHHVGWHPHIYRYWPLLPVFHLEQGEFIAVVTTTTASVFGFLVIVANYLFRRK